MHFFDIRYRSNFISISFVLGLELCTYYFTSSGMMMRALVIFVLFGGVLGAPNWRGGRQEGGVAEVIRIADEKTPILLSGQTESDNMVVVDTPPEVKEVVTTTEPAAPTPVPESVALTTEKLAQNTPDLVPSVVDIATQAPNNGPPAIPPQSPPVNATGPPRPPPQEEEDEEDSEEEAGSDEEAEEDEEEDEEDEEEGDDEEEDDEDEEEEEERAKNLKKKVKRDVNGEEISQSVQVKPAAGGSVVIDGGSGEEDVRQSDEEDKDVGEKKGGSNESVTGVPSGLQGVSALSATGEDDEADSVLQGGSKGGGSIVLGTL